MKQIPLPYHQVYGPQVLSTVMMSNVYPFLLGRLP